jgi:zinc D-Ala-D-Ala carboxypeptidase
MSWQTKNFKSSEFDAKGLPGTGAKMDATFIDMLQRTRDLAGIPFKITSGYRTKLQNIKAGGVSESAHMKGMAADIAVADGRQRFLIIRAAIQAGFTRIGASDGFVHLDNDPDLPEQVLWTY